MADTNKEKLVQKLTNIADGFRTSRSLTETLSLDDMATLAAVPIGSTENKLPQLVDGSITTITAVDLEGITEIRDFGFYGMKNLEAVELPNTIITVGAYAFAGRDNSPAALNKITTLVFPNSITAMGKSVCDTCRELQSVVLPQNPQFTRIPEYAFSGCYVLRDITIPENITRIGSYAFQKIAATSLVIPDSVSYMENSVFYSCSELTSLTLSNSLTTLSNQLLYQCSKLTNLTIPAGVTTIGNQSLSIGSYGYNATITFLSTIPPTIQSGSIGPNVKRIIVPAGCGEAYRTATNWSKFADYIEEASV